jgi:H+/gluconate symporter-like permease
MIGLLGLVLSVLLVLSLAYRGASVIVLAPMLAMLTVAFSGEIPLLAVYTQTFMPALGDFAARYFPIFLKAM